MGTFSRNSCHYQTTFLVNNPDLQTPSLMFFVDVSSMFEVCNQSKIYLIYEFANDVKLYIYSSNCIIPLRHLFWSVVVFFSL